MRLKLMLILILTAATQIHAQNELDVTGDIDWPNGTFELNITSAIEEESNQPTGRFKTEQYIIRQTPVITGQVLQEIRVDSSNTIATLISRDPVLLRHLENLSQKMTKVFTTATGDRRFLTVRYSLDIYPDLVELIIKHDKPYPGLMAPVYTPNEDFTGIIIYAGEDLPYQGSVEEQTQLKPCLFPRLYDSSMNLIHSAEMTKPEALLKWGNAGYTYSYDLNESSDRIGIYPLRTMAYKVYGKNRTDIILPDDTVKKLISSEHNRELLRQGRVVIIIPRQMKDSF